MTLYSTDHHRHGQPQVQSPGPYPPLAIAISRACGGLHTKLNEAIEDSLPLCLPPEAKDTKLYARGLAAFGMIYLTFESSWQKVVSDILSEDSSDDDKKAHAKKIAKFFDGLRPEGLERSSRLKKDLEYLSKPGDQDDDEKATIDSDKDEGKAQKSFREHIEKKTTEDPHRLYAYAWCMYMAIFAGGRYVREDFRNAGDKFWSTHGVKSLSEDDDSNKAPADRLGYSFLSFDGTDDGLSLELEFKKRLHAAEDLFTSSEKKDVVEESKDIFNLTIDLVKEMDKRITPDTTTSTASETEAAPARLESERPPSYRPSRSFHEAPPTCTLADGFDEKGMAPFTDSENDRLLGDVADEEELMAWRDPPMRRGLVFWIQMVLLVSFLVFLGCALIIGSKLYIWNDGFKWRDCNGRGKLHGIGAGHGTGGRPPVQGGGHWW